MQLPVLAESGEFTAQRRATGMAPSGRAASATADLNADGLLGPPGGMSRAAEAHVVAPAPTDALVVALRSANTPDAAVAHEQIRRRIELQVLRTPDLRVYPTQLAIETISICNAACVMCPYPTLQRPKGRMSDETHRVLCEKVRAWGAPIRAISHAGMGEPLADRQLEKRIAHEKTVFPAAQITVFTNAGLLTAERVGPLLDSGVDCLSISLNAARAATYERVMKLPFARTQDHLTRLLRANRRRKKPLKIQVSLIPTEHHSPEEIEEFRARWTGVVDAVIVPPWISWGAFFAHDTAQPQWPCRYVWDVLMVDWDGTVKMCCEDYESRFAMGNVLTDELDAIFNSAQVLQQRRAQLAGDFTCPSICRNCVESHDEARNWWRRAELVPR